MARLVIAFGGNALIREDERGTWPEQTVHALEAARAIARMGRADEVVLTHGNGPQVGALALQQAIGEPHAPALPLDVLDAMTQGEIGYLLQQALTAVDPSLPTATVLTRVLVADDDPAFAGGADEADRRLPERGRGAQGGPRAWVARGARRRTRMAAHGAQPAARADPRGRPCAPPGRGRGARHRRRRRRHPGVLARRAPRRARRGRRQGPLRGRAGGIAAGRHARARHERAARGDRLRDAGLARGAAADRLRCPGITSTRASSRPAAWGPRSRVRRASRAQAAAP